MTVKYAPSKNSRHQLQRRKRRSRVRANAILEELFYIADRNMPSIMAGSRDHVYMQELNAEYERLLK